MLKKHAWTRKRKAWRHRSIPSHLTSQSQSNLHSVLQARSFSKSKSMSSICQTPFAQKKASRSKAFQNSKTLALSNVRKTKRPNEKLQRRQLLLKPRDLSWAMNRCSLLTNSNYLSHLQISNRCPSRYSPSSSNNQHSSHASRLKLDLILRSARSSRLIIHW